MSGHIDLSALIDEFCEDAASHLEAVEASLLVLENNARRGFLDTDSLNSLLGSFHTLKGNSGMMGFAPIQQYVHRVETVLKSLSEERRVPDQLFLETLFNVITSLRSSLSRIAEDPSTALDFSDEIMLLDCLAEDRGQSAPAPAAEKGRSVEDQRYLAEKSSTLRVNFEKLDELLNLVGELVIHRTALQSLEGRLQEAVSDKELLEDFSEASGRVAKSAGDLRDAIMKVRMLPVKVVFQRFKRLVRDLSVRHGKEISLMFEGEETELDKSVIDEIAEPLLHLIRNAADHGIEPPAVRKKKGKPAAGTIFLRARHENNNIVISVEDDGGGITADKIRESAMAKGVADAEYIASLSDFEALQLIFLPGFSTAAAITETSGRGIGLDVVKNIVSSLNGTIEIESRPGAGTSFIMKLPLTLAIISSLMVEAGGERFAVPLSGVLENVKVEREDIHLVGGREMINLRDRLLPLTRLDRYFSLPPALEEGTFDYIVVVGSGEKRGGLVVERLIGQQEVVIKAMDEYLGNLPGIAGGTILGDGRVCLILDVAAFAGSR